MEKSNFLYESGDILFIETRPNERGSFHIMYLRLLLSGGISVSSRVRLSIRTIENGIIESDWTDCGFATSNETTFTLNYTVIPGAVLQFKLEREGDGQPIRFEKIETEQSSYEVVTHPTPTIDDSMFSNINRQYETKELENNLFKKLYLRGIVPNYIERADNYSKEEDEDYISLFSAIARFFAIIIRFFKRWEKINEDEEMLKEILRNNGIQFNETQITFDELQFLVNNLYTEISKRGTAEIFCKRGDVRKDGSVVTMDGEFIRMIRADKATEILYETVPRYEVGWYLGKSSPMYRGIPNTCFDLDKLGLENYYSGLSDWNHILTFGSKSTSDYIYDGQVVKRIRFSGDSGIGRKSVATDASDYLINVDACLDYEIVIGFKVVSGGGNLYASLEGFNIDKIKLPDAFVLPNKSSVSENFFNADGSVSLRKFIIGKSYYARFIVKSYASEADADGGLNIGFGNELFFNNAYLRYILPTIRISGGTIDVWNFHIRPLVRGTNINRRIGEPYERCFSLGFLKTDKFFHLYSRNRNNTMSQDDVRDFINRYLLTYSSTNLITFIE